MQGSTLTTYSNCYPYQDCIPAMALGLDFVTLGMFIIDDIYPSPAALDQTPRTNIIGGAGTYSAIGARLLSPPPSSRSVGWIVDAGTDFPPHIRAELLSWDTTLVLRPRDAPTTRGWNGYGSNDHRAFKYLTEKKRLTADDLTPDLLASKSFHLICSATRCVDLVKRILDRRRGLWGTDAPSPLIIWEPVPDLCSSAERENIIRALKFVDVLSPNHEELAAMFDATHPDGVDAGLVEKQARELLEFPMGLSTSGAIVVRASKRGCYVATKDLTRWLPAYHQDGVHVVDPTGGGNGFLGGLAVGLVRSNFDIVEAARWGTVAASLCIEQVGVPSRNLANEGGAEGERWNTTDVMARLADYRSCS